MPVIIIGGHNTVARGARDTRGKPVTINLINRYSI